MQNAKLFDKTTKAQNSSQPVSLPELATQLLASNVGVAGSVLNAIQTPELQEQKDFINLLPRELKRLLITMVPPQNWKPLFNLNREWRALVLSSATLCLDNAIHFQPIVL